MDWNPVYSVDNETLDSQHRSLFGIIGELQSHLAEDSPTEGVAECLGRLLAYAQEHFAFEERLMSEAGYPALDEHRQQHAALRQDLAKLRERFERGDTETRDDLYFLLVSGWLASHILGADKGYSTHLKRHFGQHRHRSPPETSQTPP